MADADHGHKELIDYLLDELDPERRAAFESHLSGCATCTSELERLEPVTSALAAMEPAVAPPPDLRATVMAAVANEAAAGDGVAPAASVDAPPAGPAPPRLRSASRDRGRSRWPRRLGFAAAFAALAAVVVVTLIAVDPFAGDEEPPVEIAGTLQGDSAAEIVVSRLGSGREIELTSSDLPILPDGEAYELWFVGPGDTPDDPNRISGGTFHPDEAGDTDVTLHAAVDPALFPLIEVTAEPDGGDPAVEGPVVLELDSDFGS